MAGTKVNAYTIDDLNIETLMLTTDKAFKGLDQLTLTHMTDTTVPAIAAGSVIEVNGVLIKFDTEEAISTTDPHTSATVANGIVYIYINGTTMTASFTATAPTWSNSKQGFYGLTTWANWRYIPVAMLKATSSYSGKSYFIYRNLTALNFNLMNLTCANITSNIVTCNELKFADEGLHNIEGLTHLTGQLNSSGIADVTYPSGWSSVDTVIIEITGSPSGYNFQIGGINYTLEDAHIALTASSVCYSWYYRIIAMKIHT